MSLVLLAASALNQLELDRLRRLVSEVIVLVLLLVDLALSLALVQEERALGSLVLISVNHERDGSLEEILRLTHSIDGGAAREVASQVQILPGDHCTWAQVLNHGCGL